MNSTAEEKIPSKTTDHEISDDHTCAMSYQKKRCGFCGSTENHTRIRCPVRRSAINAATMDIFLNNAVLKTSYQAAPNDFNVAALSPPGASQKVNLFLCINGVSAKAQVNIGLPFSHVKKNNLLINTVN